ncbi:MAG: nucleoside deaminase [Polyangia bacterium]
MVDQHSEWMAVALELAGEAARDGEVPVGCAIVRDGEVVGRGRNRRERDGDPLAHAEMLAISEAARRIGSWRLEQTALYVTLEPCPMCAGAIVNARVPLVVYGADDPKAGAVRTLFRLLDDERLNHRCEVISGVRAEESARLLKHFFAELRGNHST